MTATHRNLAIPNQPLQIRGRPHMTMPASAFIYATVLEGAIVSKVNEGPETVYRAGESWSELPGDRHAVSRKASSSEQARLLAVFVLDTGETNLVLPY